MKFRHLLAIAILLAFITGAFFIGRTTADLGSPPQKKEPTVPLTVEAKSRTNSDAPTMPAKNHDTIRGQHIPESVSSLEFNNSIPYTTTILRLSQQRPDLEINPENAKRLQGVYTKLCQKRAQLEVRLAKITNIEPNKRLIEIPSYADQGSALTKELDEQLTLTLGQEHAAKVIQAVNPLFAGDNGDLGAQPRTLLITETPGQPYRYEVVRDVQIIDPNTNQITASATAIDNLNSGDFGPYSGQESFFPNAEKR